MQTFILTTLYACVRLYAALQEHGGDASAGYAEMGKKGGQA